MNTLYKGKEPEAEAEENRQVSSSLTFGGENMGKQISADTIADSSEKAAAGASAADGLELDKEPLIDVLDDEYGDFTQEGGPYTVPSLPVWITALIVLGILAVASGIGLYWYRKALREQWILQQVDTVSMAEARENAYMWTLPATNLLRKAQSQEDVTLYNATYFPGQHTLLATVEIPDHFSQLYCFVVDESGHTYAGWYNSSVVQYGIAKVAFEHIPTNQILYLDCVDGTEVGDTYHPEQTYTKKIRFTLDPPVGIPQGSTKAMDTAE